MDNFQKPNLQATTLVLPHESGAIHIRSTLETLDPARAVAQIDLWLYPRDEAEEVDAA